LPLSTSGDVVRTKKYEEVEEEEYRSKRARHVSDGHMNDELTSCRPIAVRTNAQPVKSLHQIIACYVRSAVHRQK